jgi:uncharacterized membrane protein
MNRSRLWLVLGLGSAVLNVFLIGFLAGRHALGPGGCGARGFRHNMQEMHAPFAKQLPPGDRARLREKLSAVREARARVREALVREPYQAAQLEAALGALRERSAELQLDTHRELLENAGQLSIDERRRLADSRFLRPSFER